MALAAIELNDTGVTLAREGALLARSPGFALLEGDTVTIGEDALRQARLKPRMVSSRFWERLSTEPVMSSSTADSWTCADLVRAHMARIWNGVGAGVDGLVLVVPGHFNRHQLGLLLGIAEQLDLPVRGMVECAVAACGSHVETDLVVHVAVYLHRAVVTGVELADGARRTFTVSLEGHGLIQLYERWTALIANRFVTSTRFDPLHNAETEQAIYDRLPRWLATLATRERLRIEIVASDGGARAIEVSRIEVEECARELYDALHAVIVEHCSGRRVMIELDDVAADMPGLAASLVSDIDGRALRLPPGAGALGALTRARWIIRADWRNTLTIRIPPEALDSLEVEESSP